MPRGKRGPMDLAMHCVCSAFLRWRRIRGDSGVPELRPQIRDIDYGTGAEAAPMAFARWGFRGTRADIAPDMWWPCAGQSKKHAVVLLPLIGIRQQRSQVADFPAECCHAEGPNVAVECHGARLPWRWQPAGWLHSRQRVLRRRLWRGFSRASIAPWIR